jgi:tRNA (guanine-N7-)-methyltransferase
MRLRYVKGARSLIESHPERIIDDKTHKALDLSRMFPIKQPLHLEIGMGKGQFVHTIAKQHPTINYIGIEKFDSAIVKALYKVLEEPLDNLYLLRADAMFLSQLLGEQSVSRIYLNFSDPWPKERHQKRRLTHPNFLKQYRLLLEPGGEIHFKTDNRDLFDYSLETMQKQGMDLTLIEFDLHQHQPSDNIMTEFEERFVNEGKPIHKVIAHFKEENNG